MIDDRDRDRVVSGIALDVSVHIHLTIRRVILSLVLDQDRFSGVWVLDWDVLGEQGILSRVIDSQALVAPIDSWCLLIAVVGDAVVALKFSDCHNFLIDPRREVF